MWKSRTVPHHFLTLRMVAVVRKGSAANEGFRTLENLSWVCTFVFFEKLSTSAFKKLATTTHDESTSVTYIRT